MNKQIIIIIALLGFVLQLQSQNQQWFTYVDGHPVSGVEEHHGTYWISTLGGLVYFTDPNEVYHLDQSNSPINTNEFSAMDMDANGGLWLGTTDGDIYSYINGQWTFYSDAKIRKHSVLRIDKIIVDHNNQVWFTRQYMDPPKEKSQKSGITARAYGEDYELVKLDKDQFIRQEIKATSVFDISLGEDNSLLLATNDGLKLFNNNLKKIKLPEEANVNNPYTALLDSQGDYWVSSGKLTWKRIDDKWQIQKIYSSNGQSFSVPVEQFDVVNDNEIAASTLGEVFIGNVDQWKQIDREKLKVYFGKNVNLEHTFFTKKGELFANTRVGLIWFKDDQIITINTSNSTLRGSTIQTLYIDEVNTIHFKSENRTYQINEDQWTSTFSNKYWWDPDFDNLSKTDQDLIGNFIRKQMKAYINKVITDRNGTIWISTNKGLVEYKNGDIQLHDKSNSDLPSNTLFGVAEGPDHAIWIGLDSGVVEWKNKEMIYHPLESRYRGAQHKKICFHPDGRVFVSGTDGFHIYDRKKWTHINEGLPKNKTINDMVVDMNGTLWLGTYGSGILRYDNDGIKNITTEGTGLSSNTIFAMSVDRYNNIWLGTQQGLCVHNEAGLVGQVADDGMSPYYRIQENSPYSVNTQSNGENTTDLKVRFKETENLFTEINLFPNPTPGQFTIKLISVKNKKTIYQLFNFNGQLIKSKNAQGENQEIQMDLSDQPTGPYLLRIRQGDVVVSERVIKI